MTDTIDTSAALSPDRHRGETGVLRTEHLVKRYRSRTVVNDVSIELRQGEIVGLLGPNGAGKTTTFYMTVGLVVPNGGRYILMIRTLRSFPSIRGLVSA